MSNIEHKTGWGDLCPSLSSLKSSKVGQSKWCLKSLHAASHRDRFIRCYPFHCHMHNVVTDPVQVWINIHIKILTLFLLVLGRVGRVPLAFMLLTSLLKADMSESHECGRALEPPVKASSKCSAMNGVPFPLCGGDSFCTRGSKPSFIPFIPPSTSSNDSTAPQLAGDRWTKI